jgi:hypothetical protein
VRYPYPGGVGSLGSVDLAAYAYSRRFQDPAIEAVEKARKTFWQKDFFPRKILTQRGFPPSSPQGRVGFCRGKADPSLTVRLYLCM